MYDTYDAWHENLIAHLYGGCECHDSEEHEFESSCRCENCYSYLLDIVSDQKVERAMWPDL